MSKKQGFKNKKGTNKFYQKKKRKNFKKFSAKIEKCEKGN